MTDETIRTKAINYSRDHFKEIIAYAIAIASSVVAGSMAYGHKQADAEMVGQKVDALVLKVDKFEMDTQATLQKHGEELAAVKATSEMTQSDVRDLKHLADHAQDVAEQFKVPRLTGHRAKH